MSKFLNSAYKDLVPYVPGEQPKDRAYVKLNTNESPFPPSPFALKLLREAASDNNLYPDPEYTALLTVAAEKWGVKKENMLFTNGSDEALSFAFSAYCGKGGTAVFADITYGFYEVFADFYGAKKKIIPLKENFVLNADDYKNAGGTVFIANPNAPTGLLLTLADIESVLKSNPDNVVVIDEAYIDFGGKSAVPLIKKYDNIIVVRTFSKSRSLAGIRLGVAIADEKLISDLKLIKYSTNPYNVSKASMYAGIGALIDEEYFTANREKIILNREKMKTALIGQGFSVTDSKANFVFAKYNGISGEKMYLALKNKGVLVRYFDKKAIKDYVRITVGSDEDTDALLKATASVIKENL